MAVTRKGRKVDNYVKDFKGKILARKREMGKTVKRDIGHKS